MSQDTTTIPDRAVLVQSCDSCRKPLGGLSYVGTGGTLFVGHRRIDLSGRWCGVECMRADLAAREKAAGLEPAP